MKTEESIDASVRRQFLATIETGTLEDVLEVLRSTPEIVRVRNSSGRTPLMIAAYFGKQDMCDALLSSGADLADVDNNGRSANNYLENIGEVKNIEPIRMSFQEASLKVTLEAQREKISTDNVKSESPKKTNNDIF